MVRKHIKVMMLKKKCMTKFIVKAVVFDAEQLFIEKLLRILQAKFSSVIIIRKNFRIATPIDHDS